MPGKCFFNPLWLENADYKDWLVPVTDSKHKAKCKLCVKEFDITKMGESALKSHMKGTKHVERKKNKTQSRTLTNLLFSSKSSANAPSTSADTQSPIATNSESISSYVLKNDVLDAEILWSLKCINSRYS
ncbi:hypothetical protein AVEN_179013-1 [Araneus ventricosus]|uniref:Uncharacterized protein n=1 Tax=Araneus ventricosus TaxID=182803 RepID=A0A4Y2H3G8_ARAVE|nr:hypothetical protein AVEN_179013-1 [Araneus ventricosus]